jgi:tetratricopeptide (TPR) repeat protein
VTATIKDVVDPEHQDWVDRLACARAELAALSPVEDHDDQYLYVHASLLVEVGQCLMSLGLDHEAVQPLAAAEATLRYLPVESAGLLATTRLLHAVVLIGLGAHELALELLEKILIAGVVPNAPKAEAIVTKLRLTLLMLLDRLPEANVQAQEALDAIDVVGGELTVADREVSAVAHRAQALFAQRLRQLDTALAASNRSVAARTAIWRQTRHPEDRQYLAIELFNRATILDDLGHKRLARTAFKDFIDHQRTLRDPRCSRLVFRARTRRLRLLVHTRRARPSS